MKKKTDFFKYIKNFSIASAAIVTAYGGFKLIDSVIAIIPIVENIQQVQSEQTTQMTDIQNEIFDVRLIQCEQIKAIETLSAKHNELLYTIPQITKQNMKELLMPVQEELKKNDYTTQSKMNERGAS